MSAPPSVRGLVLGALIAACACACACSSQATAPPGLTTDTDSRSLPDAQRRVEFLARYLRSKSPITDAEYTIHYRDNGGGSISGPSDWDIRAVLQLADDGSAWHAGWEPCPTAAGAAAGTPDAVPAWARALLDRRPAWRTPRASPGCFRDPRHRASTVIVYAEDHLVAYGSSSE
ncbi:MAG TPA: hypothetical protein VK601_28880 [Kofleriaceae bacterium]|nr:hypothetical protein [Kofleriaceae bacterium]